MNYYVVDTAKPNFYSYTLYKHFACTLNMLVKEIDYCKYILFLQHKNNVHKSLSFCFSFLYCCVRLKLVVNFTKVCEFIIICINNIISSVHCKRFGSYNILRSQLSYTYKNIVWIPWYVWRFQIHNVIVESMVN